MTVLDMNPATLPADARALFETMAARRKAKGEGFGGPYVALLNHPELARRVEELGFFLKFEGALPRLIYQFIVLSIARATGADYEWQDHIAHARAAGLPQDVIDCIGTAAYRVAAGALCAGARDSDEDDGVAGRAGRSAGAGRSRMGQARTGRNRGAIGLLPDVRRDQSGLRHPPRPVGWNRRRSAVIQASVQHSRARTSRNPGQSSPL